MRLIDSDGKQLGIFDLREAENIAEEKGLDLILVSSKANPPVVKLGDYRNYLYQKEKKERKLKKKQKETKEIRIGFNEALFDMQRKAKVVSEFLNEGHQVQIKLILRGRERNFPDLAKEKLNKFLSLIDFSYKISSPLKETSNFLLIILSK